MVLPSVTKQEIEQALDEIDHGAIPRNRRSTGYCLVARGKHYPPTHVLRLIYKKNYINDNPDLARFSGGALARKRLEVHEYEILKHGCRNPQFKIVD